MDTNRYSIAIDTVYNSGFISKLMLYNMAGGFNYHALFSDFIFKFFFEVTVLLYIHVGSSHDFISKLTYALLADGNYYYTLFLQIRNTFKFSLDL